MVKDLIFRKPRSVNGQAKPRQLSSSSSSSASASPRVEAANNEHNESSTSSIYSVKQGSDPETNVRRPSAANSIGAFGGRISPAVLTPLSQSLPDDQILAHPTTSMQLEVSPQPIFLARSSVASLRKLASQGANQQRSANNVSNSGASSATSSGGSSPTVNAETFGSPIDNPAMNGHQILSEDRHVTGVNIYNCEDRHVNSSPNKHQHSQTTQKGSLIIEPNMAASNTPNDPNYKDPRASTSWSSWLWPSSSAKSSEPPAAGLDAPPCPDRSTAPLSDQAPPPAEDQNSAEKENNPSEQSTSWVSYLWRASNTTDSSYNSQASTMTRRPSQKDLKSGDETFSSGEPLAEGTKSPPPSPVTGPVAENNSNSSGGNNGARYWAFWARSSGKDSEFSMSDTSTEHNPHKAKQMEELSEIPKDQIDEIKAATKSKGKKATKARLPSIVTPTSDMCYTFYSSTARIRNSWSKISHYFLPRPTGSSVTTLYEPLYRTAPVKIKKVVVIGVHGFFPAKVVRAVIGDPTGTSIKFVNEAAKSVERWASEKGVSVQIEKIALEGEGKVLKRVETLYQMLCNWLHLIDEADFIYFAAHSQGTPVAVHLLAKLVEDGHVENKRVALLGMAGISLGPIYGLDQKLFMRAISQIESASLQELFEFQNLQSTQSRKYIESLRTIIAHNAKIVFVGSVNDQLVPLYSSICAHASHPNIFRSAFIDSQNVAPEFISTVISIALQLRNIGSSDHGLIREISSALPGTLTSGGHSRIYDEGRVYDLLMKHALETTDAPSNIPLRIDASFEIPKNNHNPYLLPWSMRGLVNEASMRPAFSEQLQLLHTEFKQWNPEAKPLKDLKYRLSAIQSRL